MDRQAQVQQDSKTEGNRLAHLYDGSKDQSSVDKQVHDALLQDAIKDHHSEIDLKVVRDTMQQESEKTNNRSAILKNEDYKMVRKWGLPVVGLEIEGMVLYDPIEASKAVAADDKRREAEKTPATPQQVLLNLNPFEAFGIPAALGYKGENK